MGFSLHDEESELMDSSSDAAKAARTLYPLDKHQGGFGVVQTQEGRDMVKIVIHALVDAVMGSFADLDVRSPVTHVSSYRGCSAVLRLDQDNRSIIVLETARLSANEGLSQLTAVLASSLQIEKDVLYLELVRVPGDTRRTLNLHVTDQLIHAVHSSYEKANDPPGPDEIGDYAAGGGDVEEAPIAGAINYSAVGTMGLALLIMFIGFLLYLLNA